ncbi:MAG: hypothetical protein HeimC3_52570 [Candidatus Heimdallarchaeota archaeon LC_3]|nr:MAG: hypothetical protein HeimC3_52570 [Candidatus Heimdallarchaeota archaeon LC_3]
MTLSILIGILYSPTLNLGKKTTNKISNRLFNKEIFKKKLSNLNLDDFNKIIKSQFEELKKMFDEVLALEGYDTEKIEELGEILSTQIQKDFLDIRTDQKNYFKKIQEKLDQNRIGIDDIIKESISENLNDMRNIQWSQYEEFRASFSKIQKQLNMELKIEMKHDFAEMLNHKFEDFAKIMDTKIIDIQSQKSNSLETKINFLFKLINEIPKRRENLPETNLDQEDNLTADDWEIFQERGVPKKNLLYFRIILAVCCAKIKDYRPDISIDKHVYREFKGNRINITKLPNKEPRIIQFFLPKTEGFISMKLMEKSDHLSERTKEILENSLFQRSGEQIRIDFHILDQNPKHLNQLFSRIVPDYFK